MSCLVFNSCEFGQLLRARIITWSRHSKTSKTFKLYRSCCCCCDIISIIKIPNVDSFQARSASQFTGKFSLGEINLSDSNSGMTWVCWPKAMTSGSSSKQNCTVHSRFHGHKEQFLYWSCRNRCRRRLIRQIGGKQLAMMLHRTVAANLVVELGDFDILDAIQAYGTLLRG